MDTPSITKTGSGRSMIDYRRFDLKEWMSVCFGSNRVTVDDQFRALQTRSMNVKPEVKL